MIKEYDVLGLGAAIVDVISQVEDSFIVKNGLQKNSMKLIDEAESKRIYQQFDNPQQISGGSVANSMAGLSSMGLKVAHIAKVKDDELGAFFEKDMQKSGVDFVCNKSNSGESTAVSIISVTADGERSMATYLGATRHLSESDIDEDTIKKSKIIYIEGYSWDEEKSKKAILKSVKIAKENNVKVAFSLSDPFCVQRHKKEFLELITNYVDIVFSNQEEAMSLTDKNNMEEVQRSLSQICDIAIITQGADGSTVVKGDNIYQVKAQNNIKLVDTTGAGDAYAAGFLYNLTKEKPFKECASLGNKCASKIIQKIGARDDFSEFIA